MAEEFCVIYADTPDGFAADLERPEILFRLEGKKIFCKAKDEKTVNKWNKYFKESPDWENIHLKESSPLQSLFRNPYTSVRFFKNKDDAQIYTETLKKINSLKAEE